MSKSELIKAIAKSIAEDKYDWRPGNFSFPWINDKLRIRLDAVHSNRVAYTITLIQDDTVPKRVIELSENQMSPIMNSLEKYHFTSREFFRKAIIECCGGIA